MDIFGKEARKQECSNVSPLRRRMIEDMTLAGLKASTQETYISAVVRLQKVTGCIPNRLSEEQVRNYLIWLRDTEGVAKGTFQTNLYGLKFFFHITLNRDWSLFTKKKFVSPGKSEFLSRCRGRIAHA